MLLTKRLNEIASAFIEDFNEPEPTTPFEIRANIVLRNFVNPLCVKLMKQR